MEESKSNAQSTNLEISNILNDNNEEVDLPPDDTTEKSVSKSMTSFAGENIKEITQEQNIIEKIDINDRFNQVKNFNNENVLKYYRLIGNKKVSIEKYSGLSLFDLLHKKKVYLNIIQKIYILSQIFNGIKYLVSQNFSKFPLSSHCILLVEKYNPQMPEIKIGNLLYEINKPMENWYYCEYLYAKENTNYLLYSLGVLMWEILTGWIPYEDIEEKKDENMIYNLLKDERLQTDCMNNALPRKCVEIMYKLLNSAIVDKGEVKKDFLIGICNDFENKFLFNEKDEKEIFLNEMRFYLITPIDDHLSYICSKRIKNVNDFNIWAQNINKNRSERLLSYIGTYTYTYTHYLKNKKENKEILACIAYSEPTNNSLDSLIDLSTAISSLKDEYKVKIIRQIADGLQFIKDKKLYINKLSTHYIMMMRNSKVDGYDYDIKIANYGPENTQACVDNLFPVEPNDIKDVYTSFGEIIAAMIFKNKDFNLMAEKKMNKAQKIEFIKNYHVESELQEKMKKDSLKCFEAEHMEYQDFGNY